MAEREEVFFDGIISLAVPLDARRGKVRYTDGREVPVVVAHIQDLDGTHTFMFERREAGQLALGLLYVLEETGDRFAVEAMKLYRDKYSQPDP